MLEMLEVERPTVVVADFVHWVGRATGLAVFNLNHMALNEEVEGQGASTVDGSQEWVFRDLPRQEDRTQQSILA